MVRLGGSGEVSGRQCSIRGLPATFPLSPKVPRVSPVRVVPGQWNGVGGRGTHFGCRSMK